MNRTLYKKKLNELRDIAAKAEREGRDFTPAERADVIGRTAELKQAKAEVKADADLAAAIDDLGAQIGGVGGGTDPSVSASLPGKVRASGGSGGWSKAWNRATSGQGKTLLTPGTVPVSVPLRPEPVRDAEPVLSLRQVIPTVPNTTGHYSFLRQTTRDNNAATVAAGAKKPRSAYKLERIDGRTRTIAHVSEPMHRNDLQDAPQLQQFLEAEMRYGWEDALEDEVLNGTGTPSGGSDPMTGMLQTSGVQTQAFDTDRLTTLRRAIGKLERLGFTPGAVALRPQDWEEIELTTTDGGAYALDRGGDRLPVDRAARRVWGVPVVLVLGAPEDTATVFDSSAVRLHVREEGTLTMNDGLYDPDLHGEGEGGNYFDANLIGFRFEGRADLEVSKPAGIVSTTLAGA